MLRFSEYPSVSCIFREIARFLFSIVVCSTASSFSVIIILFVSSARTAYFWCEYAIKSPRPNRKRRLAVARRYLADTRRSSRCPSRAALADRSADPEFCCTDPPS